MSGFFTDENAKLNKFTGGTKVKFKGALPIGSIFVSAIPILDDSVHLLNGDVISQEGLYEDFSLYIKSIVNAGYSISCTEQEYQNDLSIYGQCGKFVINDTYKTIRLPKITEFIASSNGGLEIGISQLDEFKSHTHIQNAHNHSQNPHAHSATTHIGWQTGGGNAVGKVTANNGNYNGWGTDIHNTTATNNDTTATNQNTGGEETRPKNIRYPYYIVLLNGFDYSSSNENSNGSTGNGSTSDGGYTKDDIDELLSKYAKKDGGNTFTGTQRINGDVFAEEYKGVFKNLSAWSDLEVLGKLTVGLGFNVKEEILKRPTIDTIYPIGSIYLTVDTASTGTVSPASIFGGTWERLPEGYALWTASSGAGNTISAGLPNITGYLHGTMQYYGSKYGSSGAFRWENGNDATDYDGDTATTGRYKFDANLGAQHWNSAAAGIYGNSKTVQPPAIKVYAWKRIG